MKRISVDVKDVFDDDVLATLPKMTANELKVLAYCVVYSGMEFEGKRCKGHFFKTNASFIMDVEICKQSWFNALNGLIKKGLLKRRSGYRTVSGIDNVASEYIIPTELTELNPFKMAIESDDFDEFSLDDEKDLKQDLDPIIHNNIISYNHNNINSYNHNDINSYKNKTEEQKEEIEIDKEPLQNSTIMEENKIEIKDKIIEEPIEVKPNSLKTLQDYFKIKTIKSSMNCKTVKDFQELESELLQELEEYSFISGYSNCSYSIKDFFQKRYDDLIPVGLKIDLSEKTIYS